MAYAYDGAGNRQSLLKTYTSAQPSGYIDPAAQKDIPYIVKKSEYVYSSANELLKLVETMFDDGGRQVLEKTVSYLYDNNGNELRQQVSYIRPHSRDIRQVTGGSLYGDEQTDAALNVLIEKVSNTFDGFNRLKQTERIKSGERVTVASPMMVMICAPARPSAARRRICAEGNEVSVWTGGMLYWRRMQQIRSRYAICVASITSPALMRQASYPTTYSTATVMSCRR